MSVEVYARGEFWWVKAFLQDPATGRAEKFRRTTKLKRAVTPRKVAEAYARNIESAFYNGGLAAAAEEAVTFGALARAYREHRVLNKGDLAITADNALAKLEQEWANTPVAEITSKAVQQVAVKLYPNARASTRNVQVVGVVKRVLRRGAKEGKCALPLLERFDRPPGERVNKKTPVTQEWCRAFVANCPADNPQLKALALYLFQTGTRISDAVELTWAEIDLNPVTPDNPLGPRATFYIGKTNSAEPHVAKLPLETYQAIATLPGPREGKVFGYASRSGPKTGWKSVCDKLVTLGFKRLSFHCCRHGYATHLADEGVPAKDIAKGGGWKTVALVHDTYCHAKEDRSTADKLSWTRPAAKDASVDDLSREQLLELVAQLQAKKVA